MKKQVNIKSVQVLKSGSNNGRAWTLFKFTCEDGFEFTGFDSRSSGPQEVEVEEKENQYGKQWQETKPRKANPDMDRILTALSVINEKLDRLLSKSTF